MKLRWRKYPNERPTGNGDCIFHFTDDELGNLFVQWEVPVDDPECITIWGHQDYWWITAEEFNNTLPGVKK